MAKDDKDIAKIVEENVAYRHYTSQLKEACRAILKFEEPRKAACVGQERLRRIYVAGPYSADTTIGTLNNIQRGIKQCAKILKDGRYAVYCPWADHLYHFFEPGITIEQYQKNSLAWLDASDMMLVLPGWEHSKGTKAEIARAKERGMEIIWVAEGQF